MMVWHIAAFELRRLFGSPLAWIILAILQFLSAMFFYLLLSRYLEAGQTGDGPGITQTVAAGMLQVAGIFMLMVTPFLTMRSFSEEQRSGAMQLLMSSPVSVTQLVLGKYLGLIGFLGLAVAMLCLMPLSLLPGTQLDLGLLAAAVLGLALLTTAFAAAGLFVSTLTAQPALAAVATFGILFLLWVIHIAGEGATGLTAAVFGWLSLLRHFNPLLQGIVSSADVAFFLILTGVSLLLCIWRLDALRTHHW